MAAVTLAAAAEKLRREADGLVGQIPQSLYDIVFDLLKTAGRLEKHAQELPQQCQEMRQILAELEAL